MKEPGDEEPVPEELPASSARIVLLEAESEAALRARVLEWLQIPPRPLAGGGPALRAAITFQAPEELADRLSALLEGQARPGLAIGRRDRRGLVFVFSGPGSLWPGVGRDLLRAEPLVLARLEECDRLLRPWPGGSLLGELIAGDGWHRAEVAVPGLFALQVALADLWRSWGIEPDAVIGHDCGEIAAAVVAGALTLEQGARVSALYGAARAAADVAGPEPRLDGMRAGLADLAPRPPAVPLVSSLTGGPPDRALDAEHWAAHLSRPARFAEGVAHLLAAGFDLFLEIGGDPHLPAEMEREMTAARAAGRVLPSLRRGEDQRAVLFETLGELWVAGRPVRQEALRPDPPSPWQGRAV